ncbi:MAG: hypothetical protein CMJ88_02110 [Planctomycetes bacterium]|nr:hypothetical protein [Planctomycetota bacterium]
MQAKLQLVEELALLGAQSVEHREATADLLAALALYVTEHSWQKDGLRSAPARVLLRRFERRALHGDGVAKVGVAPDQRPDLAASRAQRAGELVLVGGEVACVVCDRHPRMLATRLPERKRWRSLIGKVSRPR